MTCVPFTQTAILTTSFQFQRSRADVTSSRRLLIPAGQINCFLLQILMRFLHASQSTYKDAVIVFCPSILPDYEPLEKRSFVCLFFYPQNIRVPSTEQILKSDWDRNIWMNRRGRREQEKRQSQDVVDTKSLSNLFVVYPSHRLAIPALWGGLQSSRHST